MYNHHDPDCPNFSQRGLAGLETAIFLDIFCDCHRYPEPHVIANGTIAWPAGWTQEQADEWRKAHGLCRPD